MAPRREDFGSWLEGTPGADADRGVHPSDCPRTGPGSQARDRPTAGGARRRLGAEHGRRLAVLARARRASGRSPRSRGRPWRCSRARRPCSWRCSATRSGTACSASGWSGWSAGTAAGPVPGPPGLLAGAVRTGLLCLVIPAVVWDARRARAARRGGVDGDRAALTRSGRRAASAAPDALAVGAGPHRVDPLGHRHAHAAEGLQALGDLGGLGLGQGRRAAARGGAACLSGDLTLARCRPGRGAPARWAARGRPSCARPRAGGPPEADPRRQARCRPGPRRGRPCPGCAGPSRPAPRRSPSPCGCTSAPPGPHRAAPRSTGTSPDSARRASTSSAASTANGSPTTSRYTTWCTANPMPSAIARVPTKTASSHQVMAGSTFRVAW